MKTRIFANLLALISVTLIPANLLAEISVSASLWNTKKSEHFIVYFQDSSLSYIEELINKVESYYTSITEELGFTRFQGFWTWDNRAKIYLFKNASEYQKATNQPRWSGAQANVVTREICTYKGMEDFFNRILPHELGHIIFREFVGFKRNLPLWLDEGVVSYLEKDQKKERLAMAKILVNTAIFMPLDELGKIHRYNMLVPDFFYAEATSVVDFLIATYGKERFLEFCRRLRDLRDDQNWEIALFEIYDFKNISDVNEKWTAFLSKLSK